MARFDYESMLELTASIDENSVTAAFATSEGREQLAQIIIPHIMMSFGYSNYLMLRDENWDDFKKAIEEVLESGPDAWEDFCNKRQSVNG